MHLVREGFEGQGLGLAVHVGSGFWRWMRDLDMQQKGFRKIAADGGTRV